MQKGVFTHQFECFPSNKRVTRVTEINVFYCRMRLVDFSAKVPCKWLYWGFGGS